ncbi:hypothetical protein FGIG_09509 [Fasciola gigantica]|uniref:Uncharacterized protein n=1 Tax=Fasciola gigantica TaxID=46835 RepID=A0A504YLS2_FASGI|nr:hypothetical protein FGIG_09509 [Fasciola gigantica]
MRYSRIYRSTMRVNHSRKITRTIFFMSPYSEMLRMNQQFDRPAESSTVQFKRNKKTSEFSLQSDNCSQGLVRYHSIEKCSRTKNMHKTTQNGSSQSIYLFYQVGYNRGQLKAQGKTDNPLQSTVIKP